MANVRQMYGGQYLTAADVDVSPLKGVIVSVVVDTKLNKVALEIDGFDKELMCNKTNAMEIARVLGEDTDSWPGGIVEIKRDRVLYMGKMVDGIRVVGVEKGQARQQPQRSVVLIPATRHG